MVFRGEIILCMVLSWNEDVNEVMNGILGIIGVMGGVMGLRNGMNVLF